MHLNENIENLKVLEFGQNIEETKENDNNNMFKRSTNKFKNTNESNKNFFVFGKSSKQSNFKKNTNTFIKKKNNPNPTKILNNRYELNELDVNPDNNSIMDGDNIYDNTIIKVNYSPKTLKFDVFDKVEISERKALETEKEKHPKQPYRPRSALIKQKESISKTKKRSTPSTSTTIFLKENKNCVVYQQNLVLDDKEKNNKPLINEVLKIEFSKEDQKEFSPYPSKNRKIMRAKSAKFNIKTNSNLSSKNEGHKIKAPIKKENNKLANKFIEEMNLIGDNLQPDEEEKKSSQEAYDDKIDNNASFEATDIQIDPSKNPKKSNSHNFGSDNIIDTIKLISQNPERFKNTNKLLKQLGQFTKNNLHIVTSSEQEKLNLDNAMKDFEKSQQDRQKLLEYNKKVTETVKKNEIEQSEMKKIKGSSSANINEKDKSRLQQLIKNAKEDSKVNSSFNISKLNKKDRDVLTSKLDYVYKHKREGLDIQNEVIKNENIREMENLKKSDLNLINSKETIGKATDARKLIEGVIERIEQSNKKYVEYVEKQAMNGFVLKAYDNLYNKGKNLDTDQIKKKENKKKLNKEDLFNHVYFKSKKNQKQMQKEFHPFLADE